MKTHPMKTRPALPRVVVILALLLGCFACGVLARQLPGSAGVPPEMPAPEPRAVAAWPFGAAPTLHLHLLLSP